jgi:hypothetical protein
MLNVVSDGWLVEVMGSCQCGMIQWYRQTCKAETRGEFAKLVQWNSTYPDTGYPEL